MKIVRNILAVIAGFVIGGVVNMCIVRFGPVLIPPPPGIDVNNVDSLVKNIHLFEPRHFLSPFLAHALGSFTGALSAYLIAASRKAPLAWVLGVFNLAGGLAASYMIPAPAWFMALDILVAYLPMAWLAIETGKRLQSPAVA